MMSGLGSGLPSLDHLGSRVQASLNSPTFSIPIAWESCQRQPDAPPLSYRGTVFESANINRATTECRPYALIRQSFRSAATYHYPSLSGGVQNPIIGVGWLCTFLPDISSSRLLPSVSFPEIPYSLLSIGGYIFPGSLSIL